MKSVQALARAVGVESGKKIPIGKILWAIRSLKQAGLVERAEALRETHKPKKVKRAKKSSTKAKAKVRKLKLVKKTAKAA